MHWKAIFKSFVLPSLDNGEISVLDIVLARAIEVFLKYFVEQPLNQKPPEPGGFFVIDQGLEP